MRSEPRRLYRSRKDAIIGGVCSGLSSYLNVDASIVRLASLLLAVFNSWVLLAYVALMFLIPGDDDAAVATTGAKERFAFAGDTT